MKTVYIIVALFLGVIFLFDKRFEKLTAENVELMAQVRAYEARYQPEIGAYYKIVGYPESKAGNPSLSGVYVFVKEVKLDPETRLLVPNTYSYLREIRTTKNVILNPGTYENDPDTDGYLPSYLTVTVVNGALTTVLFDTPRQMEIFEVNKP